MTGTLKQEDVEQQEHVEQQEEKDVKVAILGERPVRYGIDEYVGTVLMTQRNHEASGNTGD